MTTTLHDALHRLGIAIREGFEPVEFEVNHIGEPGAEWELAALAHGSARVFSFDKLYVPRADAEAHARRYAEAVSAA